MKEKEIITVDQILSNVAPDDLVGDENEILSPLLQKPTSSSDDIQTNEKINGTDSNDESQVNGYIFVNKIKNFE